MGSNRDDVMTRRLIIAVSVVVVCAVGATVWALFRGNDGHQSVASPASYGGSGAPSAASSASPHSTSGAVSEGDEGFYHRPGSFFPVKMSPWQQKGYAEQSTNSKDSRHLSDAVLASYQGNSRLGTTARKLPSEAAGFTSDPSKRFKPDKVINPYYSYWTTESFTRQAGEEIERLLNPTFGGWGVYQYASAHANHTFDTSILADMFTPSFLAENKGKEPRAWVPVFADWGENDYGQGDDLLSSGPRWYGQVTGSSSTSTYDKTTQQATVNYRATVTFTAWTKTQGTLVRHGVLTVQFTGNTQNMDSPRTVLINKANLTVG